MALNGLALLIVVFFLPETSADNILYRRTLRLRSLTGDDTLMSAPHREYSNKSLKTKLYDAVLGPFVLAFSEPMMTSIHIYLALINALQFTWLESFPLVFQDIYGFSTGELGLSFIGLFIGGNVIVPPLFWYWARIMKPQFSKDGDLQPEKRLPPAIVGGFCVPICLFWFGWSSRPEVHWIMPIIGSAWFGVGQTLLYVRLNLVFIIMFPSIVYRSQVFPHLCPYPFANTRAQFSLLNYLTDAYPSYSASVLAGNCFIRAIFGAGFPLFAKAMYDRLGVGWASSLLGFLACLFIPIPYILQKKGVSLREKSKFARHDF